MWYGFEFGEEEGSIRSRSAVATHAWSRGGKYITRVTVIDDRGNKTSELREILVVERGGGRGLVCQVDRPYCPGFMVCDEGDLLCRGDRDGDGIPDVDDLCPDRADPQQEDRDEDGRGDECSSSGYDREDTYCGSEDDCPLGMECEEGLCRKKN